MPANDGRWCRHRRLCWTADWAHARRLSPTLLVPANSFALEALVLEIGGGSKSACSCGDTDSGAGGLCGMSLLRRLAQASEARPRLRRRSGLIFSSPSRLHDDGDDDDRGSRSTALGGGRRRERGWYCQAGRRQAGYGEALRQCVGTRATEKGGVGEQGDDGSE